MKRCVSVPSAVRLFYGAGCVKKRTADGTDTQRMHGTLERKIECAKAMRLTRSRRAAILRLKETPL